MNRDPFDDEGYRADANAVALSAVLLAHAQVSHARALADLDAALAHALDAQDMLTAAVVAADQWTMRLDRAIVLAGEARDLANDEPCTCVECRGHRARGEPIVHGLSKA